MFAKVAEAFETCRHLQGVERERCLEELDSVTRDHVVKLLEAHDFVDAGPRPEPRTRSATVDFSRKGILTSSSIEEQLLVRSFRVLRRLGEGGMGVVYLAHDLNLDRQVAIKALSQGVVLTSRALTRFRREARLLAALSHPNVAAAYSLLEMEESVFLVLEYVEGETVEQRQSRDPLGTTDITRVVMQISLALEAAHAVGIIHRDLKPSNVIVDSNLRVKVVDFGIAKRTGDAETTEVTLSGELVGTPVYMAPEQYKNAKVGPATDIWAVGCVLFELLSGSRAFTGDSIESLANSVLSHDPDWSLLSEACPPALIALTRDCLQKEGEERPESMTEVRHRLERLLGHTDFEEPVTFVARAHPTVRVAVVGRPLTMRVAVRNESGRQICVQAKLEAPPTSWGLVDSTRDLTLEAGSHGGCLFRIVAQKPGGMNLPSVLVRQGDDDVPATIDPVPRQVVALPATPPVVVGTREIEQVIEAWAKKPTDHAGSLLCLGGRPGSGRSLLLEAEGHRLRSFGLRVLFARARAAQHQPHRLFGDLLRDILGVNEAEHDDRSLRALVPRRLVEYLGEESTSIRYFISTLLGEEAHTPDLGTHHYHWYRLVCALTREAPTVLLVEDLHAADRESCALLSSLLERCGEDRVQFLAVVTTQTTSLASDELDRTPALSRPGHHLERRTIPRIDRPGVVELLENHYPGAAYDDFFPRLPDVLLERSGGQLAFLVELVKSLGSDSGPHQVFELRGDGRWVVTREDVAAAVAELPPQFGDYLHDRVRGLPDRYQSLLEHAALVGTEFPVSILEELHSDEDLIDEALDAMERLGLVEALDADLTRYRFIHELTPGLVRERILQRGSRAAARRKHRVAEALIATQRDGSGTEEWLGLVLVSLGRPAEARPFLLSTLHRHVVRGRFEAAHTLLPVLDDCVQRCGFATKEEELGWYVDRARVFRTMGQTEAALEATKSARELAYALDTPRAHGETLLLKASFDIEASRLDAAAERITRTLEFARNGVPKSLLLDAQHNLAVVRNRQGRPSEARDLYQQNLEVYEELGDRVGTARTLVNLGLLEYHQGAWEAARPCFESARSVAAEAGYLELEMHARVWLNNLVFVEGDLVAAQAGYLEAIERFRMLQNRKALARNHFNLSQVERFLGALDRSVRSVERAIAIGRRAGLGGDELHFVLEQATQLILRGEKDACDIALTRAQQLAELRGASYTATEVLLRRAWLLGEEALVNLDDWESADSETQLIALLLRLRCARAHKSPPDQVEVERALRAIESSNDFVQLPWKIAVVSELALAWPEDPKVRAAHAVHEELARTAPPGSGSEMYFLAKSVLSSTEQERMGALSEARDSLSKAVEPIEDARLRRSVFEFRSQALGL